MSTVPGIATAPSALRPRTRNAYDFADLSAYSWKDRMMISLADVGFYAFIASVGRTVRFEVEGWEHWRTIAAQGKQPIYSFWHDQVALATWFWRQRGIVVMTSQSRDGEYIARFIQRFGYGAARGSSTRGGVGALVEMTKLMRTGVPGAFTVDGPKGPRHVAKLGACLLAKKTGQPILPFAVQPDRYLAVNSWDKMQLPAPFTRARVRIAAPIWVPADADDELLAAKRDELQQALDGICS
jgi:lysophospholipid acyltransferase (LPLAT)-like uncharacterized protein